MIYCDISGPRSKVGGIGNNLFKIATTLGFAKKHGVDPIFSDWRYDIFKKDRVKFGIKKEHINIENAYYETSFSFFPIPFKKNLELFGYFQSEKYFEEYRDYILYCMDPKEEISKYLENKYRHIMFQETISIHVRRGDYLTSGGGGLHPVLSKNYFEESIEKMPTNSLKVIFSDDIWWCKNNFSRDCFFVENEQDYIDLFLMSKCTHHIIANSSFSWWGAYLNKNPNKIVIAPQKWFGGPLAYHCTKDLIPKDWIQI